MCQKPLSEFHQILCTCYPVAITRSFSYDSSIRYTSGFVDDVIFHMMELMGQNQIRRVFLLSSPDSGTGGEVCRLRLHLVLCIF